MPPNGNPRISFLAFFILWANRMGWEVPPLHVRVCVWLQSAWLSGDPLLLLMLPRGHAKSTILEVFNAWLYYISDRHFLRILHQSESDGTALKTSRGTQNVLRHHPLTRKLLPDGVGTIEQWWVTGTQEIDARNASMYAKGILSNVTSSRADFVQNDDIEVPKNIGTVEAREKLRYRLGEQVHIAVPGAPKMYVGTPHTHDSIYDEVKKLGANCLIVPMFAKSFRIESADKARYEVGFFPDYVFSGIGDGARLLRPGVDYRVESTVLVLANPGNDLIDCYAGAAWPERFDRDEMAKRRLETRTLNEWDSQYQLQSKPVTQVRLDPARIVPYDVQPKIVFANGAQAMWLGKVQIVSAAVRWDPSSGKVRSDASGTSVVFQDDTGRRYLHHVSGLTGEIAEFGADGKTITGGQVWQLCDVIARWSLPRVTVETNGIGGFAPAVLRAALKQRKIRCGVVEEHSTANKNKRILEAFEPLLLSRGMLWAHVDVLRGPFWQQMRDWNPATANQPDDLLDASAGAIAETPERFKGIGKAQDTGADDWRPYAGTAEAVFER
jgi:hypothetical protein